jgi:hypothetical protein
MGERREDLSTADLAGQQPRDPARADLTEAADRERRDDRAPADLARDDLAASPARTEDRAADRAPGDEFDRDRLEQQDDRTTEVAATDQEPAPAAVGEPAATMAPDAGAAGTTTAGPLLAADDAEGFRARWTDVQNGFVDAPRQAVEQADELVAEVMQHLARTFADERGRLEGHWDRGDEVSTDDLRTAFQRYRSFFERLLAT